MNVTVGHIMMTVMHELINSSPIAVIKVFSFLFIIMMYFVELFSAVLQSYIFVLMIAGYIDDITNEDH
jgi:F0F1-type ATP synthase membrane subunit a